MTMRAKEYEGMPPSAWQSMWHSCRRRSTGRGSARTPSASLSLSRRRLYPRPVPEGQHQGHQSGLQFSQSCQVIGGQTGNVVPCRHFTEQAAAEKRKSRERVEEPQSPEVEFISFITLTFHGQVR